MSAPSFRSTVTRLLARLSGLGLLALAAGCGGGGGAPPQIDPLCGYDEAPGGRVVDLGAEGLQPGGLIDPYLETWVQEGNEVHVPAGTYRWNGGGFNGKDLSDVSVIGDGVVVLDAGDGHHFEAVWAIAGPFELRNVAVRGRRAPGVESMRVLVTDSRASAAFVNVTLPDGSWDGGGAGIRVPPEHAGTLWFIDTTIEGFAGYGLHASDPGLEEGRNGAVHVVRGLFRNNNLAGIRVGSDGSSIRDSVVVSDEEAPATLNGGRNQRGIRVRHVAAGDGIVIEGVHLTQAAQAAAAIVVDGEPGGSGAIMDVRIHNAIENPPISIRTEESTWTGEGIHVTGEGNREPMGGELGEVCAGEDCELPKTAKPVRPEVCVS